MRTPRNEPSTDSNLSITQAIVARRAHVRAVEAAKEHVQSGGAKAGEVQIDWSQALTEHQTWIRSVLRSRVSDGHAVEDLFQEISLAVVRQNSRPTDPEKVAPWLYRLAVRYSINFHRRNGRQRRMLDRMQTLANQDNNESVDALRWLVQDEQTKLLKQAMQQMLPQDREILILKYTENWTYKQLARHLGAGLNTIEYRLLRAKKRLRKLLNSLSTQKVWS